MRIGILLGFTMLTMAGVWSESRTMPRPVAVVKPAAFDIAELIIPIIKVESSGNPRAVSPRGAVGLMQLMPLISNHYKVNPHDPRQNIKGGFAFLRDLHRKYKDVPLTVAAFNAGETKVDEAIKRARTRDFKKVRQYLPSETVRYVPKVLALLD